MVQESRVHQLRLGVYIYPIVHKVFYIQTVVGLGISEASTALPTG